MLRIRLLVVAAAASVAVLLLPAGVRAGCLAPADTAVDVPAEATPIWGGVGGDLVYARSAASGKPTLVVRSPLGSVDVVAVKDEQNDFVVGLEHERWQTFHTVHANGGGDLAFVASTTIPDEPSTAVNEGAPRRGAYARSGPQLYRCARFGEPSPVRDAFNQPVNWGSVFEAVAFDPDPQGYLRVMFNGQLAGQFDQRIGLFQWIESQPNTSVPVILTGDPAPSGGAFTSLGRMRATPAGDVVFFAVTRASDTAPQVPGLYLLRQGGGSARIVKFGTAGDAAPGGGTFGIAGDFDVDPDGVVTFAATLTDAPSRSALFRAAPPLYEPSLVIREGDATPIAGVYGAFSRATVRANAGGEVVLAAEVTGDSEGDGIFLVAPGTTAATPLLLVDDAIGVAAIGAGRAAYTTATSVRVVVPADGTEEGPTDFRLAKLDLRNAVPLKTDTLTIEGRFLLPRWDVVPPATLRAGVTRATPTAALTGAALTELAEVKLFSSGSPGNNFVFGITDTAGTLTGTVRFNGQAQESKGLSVAADGTSAVWKFAGNPGPGSFALDLLAGTFSLKVKAATIQPSYEAGNFRVALVLRSRDDVTAARADASSWFHRDIRVDGQQPNFGAGRRVTSAGEVTPGGTLFVDALTVNRKPAKGGKPAADALSLTGTLRLCPGAALPATSTLDLSLTVGSFQVTGASLSRVGRTAVYRGTASGAAITVDLTKGTFTVAAKSVAPIAGLVDAVAGSASNGPERLVGGMHLPFSITIPRVYEASYDVPVVRLPKGKVFRR